MSASQIILLVSSRLDDFKEFVEPLQAAGKTVLPAATMEEALDAAVKTVPILAILDNQVQSVSGMEIAGRLLQVNAFIYTALVSDLDEETFHEKSEGLGILTRLPMIPGADEARDLLDLLNQVAANMET